MAPEWLAEVRAAFSGAENHGGDGMSGSGLPVEQCGVLGSEGGGRRRVGPFRRAPPRLGSEVTQGYSGSNALREMFSLFVNASGVRVSIHGKGVAGRPFPRDVAGKASSTAFLAFSETWVRR